MRTVADVVAATRRHGLQLAAPEYIPREGSRVALMVESMRKHTTDEGYQLALALRAGGYFLEGRGFGGRADVPDILTQYNPAVVVVQDKREWTGTTAGPGFDHREKFVHANELARRPDVFKAYVLKDAHSDAALHTEASLEVGAHCWVVYYHPDIVAAQAPYVRREHLVRTYHSLDANAAPPFSSYPVRERAGLLSGAVSAAYPLRSRLALAVRNGQLKNVTYFEHPGYGRSKCWTPHYLDLLSRYKIAVCTSSRFGYAVRKIVEATACGCRVVTDLPSDDVLPEVDGNLVRIDSDTSPPRVDELVGELASTWDERRQREWAERARRYYDYRQLGSRLALSIEAARRSYRG